MEKLYKKSNYYFIILLLAAIAGFYRTYFGLFPGFVGVSGLIHFHAFMVLLWFVLLIAQPVLISRKQLALHRLIGKASYVVVGLLVLSMILLLRISLQKENAMLIGIADVIFFVAFYLLAMFNSKNTPYHIRYIIICTLPFINPSLGRLGLPSPLFGLAIIIGLLIFERFNKRIYKPYLLALPAFLIIYIVFIFVIDINMWNNFWSFL